ncbi:esterase/lipase family protein [Pontiella sulfatireligans]|uniref:DUF676 domain-containing protein n=1 Tax=Pontiella sulfatireligans TaxID=2750658 RepID=A0A6C2USI3_9BACT|nr:hypothetical protein [Pontiella sulfatireligans]VGO22214.1 hypothetical protein SCARR_04296 [Pontiella sulfatireligans]
MTRLQFILAASAFLWVNLAIAQAVPQPTFTVRATSAPPYSATGELFILQTDTNTTALVNPVLVVEGFDIGNSMDWPELYDLLNKENLVTDLQSYGRDLIVLNFGDSTADILANSALTEAAVNYVNSHRSNPSDKFTAIGASLGGLTLRKALVGLPYHDVNTWISFDAPHEGANLPLGVQEFFEYFSTVNLPTFDPIREFLLSLDTPAARQMLLVHHSHSPDAPAGASAPERQEFVNTMTAAGYPANCKTIAISNGSGYGEKLPFNPGDLMLHWEYNGGGFLDPNIDADIYALPQSDNAASTVFYGDFDAFLFGRPEKTVNTYHPLSLDNAPGGYRTTFFQIFTNLPPDYIDGDDYIASTNHCFIPTVSALGIPIENIESNLASHAELTALSPFDEIHYAVNNEEHVEINARNKRWIMRAVLEDHDSDGDGFDDYQEFLLGTAYDDADSTLTVYAVIEVHLVDGTAALSWNAYPNTQYAVRFTEALDEPWLPLETIPPTSEPDITREYLLESEALSGFFQIIATPVDPVTD